MLYISICNNRIENTREQVSSPFGFPLGSPTTPYRCDDPDEAFHHSRAQIVQSFVADALSATEVSIPAQTCGFWLGDMRDTACKYFAWGAACGTDNLIPDPSYLISKGYLHLRQALIPWKDKVSKVFWRGGLTRPMHFWNKDADEYPRYKLVAKLATNPNCDVKLAHADYSLLTGPSFYKSAEAEYKKISEDGRTTRIFRRLRSSILYRSNFQELDAALVKRDIRIIRESLQHDFINKLIRKCYVGKPLPMQTWGKYRYTVDIDGFGPSWKLYPCLALGMVVFKVESTFKLFFSDLLKPYVHYIPVDPDLSNLESQINWAFENYDHCEEISRNARAICQDHLDYKSSMGRLTHYLAS